MLPVVNTSPYKTLLIELKSPYLAITDNAKFYTHPLYMVIMKYLASKGHYSSLSGGLFPMKNSKNCALALYFQNDA